MTATADECPYCRAELPIPDEGDRCRCSQCGCELDARVQRLFRRACERFSEGQAVWLGLLGRTTRPHYAPQARAVFGAYQQAHSALLEAFQCELPPSQRETGIEMMAEVVQVFQQRGMVSGLEARYWTRLVVEQNARRECEAIADKLVQPRRGCLWGLLGRWRWRLRRWQLGRALRMLDREIRQIEALIGFVEPPRTRRV